jgi:hypothetical protein
MLLEDEVDDVIEFDAGQVSALAVPESKNPPAATTRVKDRRLTGWTAAVKEAKAIWRHKDTMVTDVFPFEAKSFDECHVSHQYPTSVPERREPHILSLPRRATMRIDSSDCSTSRLSYYEYQDCSSR